MSGWAPIVGAQIAAQMGARAMVREARFGGEFEDAATEGPRLGRRPGELGPGGERRERLSSRRRAELPAPADADDADDDRLADREDERPRRRLVRRRVRLTDEEATAAFSRDLGRVIGIPAVEAERALGELVNEGWSLEVSWRGR